MERRLAGGRNGGAVLVEGTVRRPAVAQTPAVQALLRHPEAVGFAAAPRALGLDDAGREVVGHLAGSTIGDALPWPAWVRSDGAIAAVGGWLRGYHDAVRSFSPPAHPHWFGGRDELRPGDIIGHNDAGPYNAVWREGGDGGRLVGVIDWELAQPMPRVRDLAFVAISWIPLMPAATLAAQGFPDDLDRDARLGMLLDAYGWDGGRDALLDAVVERAADHADGLRRAALDGYAPAAALIGEGVADAFDGVRDLVRALRR